MKRKDFTTTIRGKWFYSDNNGSSSSGTVLDAKRASEATSGIIRHKPTGWIPPTGYSFERTRYDREVGTNKVTSYWSDGSFSSSFTYSGVVGGVASNSLTHFDEIYQVDSDLTSHTDKALVKARLQMKRSDVNLAVAFAERDQTARLVGSTASKLAKTYLDIREGNFGRAWSRLGIGNRRSIRGRDPHDIWLELQYGWKPLLSDVYGACSALEKRDRHDWIVTGKGSSRDKVDEKLYADGYRFDGFEGRARGTRGSFVRIDAIPGNDLLGSLSSMGVTNPLLVAWELLPYSFVVDWFLPVGNWLSSLDAMLGYDDDNTHCSISEFQRINWVTNGISYRRPEDYPQYYEVENAYVGSKDYVSLSRIALTSVPLPSRPRLKDPRSLTHMANGLSLLASAFSR